MTAIAFDAELVIPALVARTPDEAIAELGALLVAHGCVNPEYVDAAVERERELPTGLPTEPIGVAVPHADPDHVHRPAIAIGRSVVPISFAEMGAPDRRVAVRFVFLLALSSKDQASALSSLVVAFQRPGFLEALLAAPSGDAIAALATSSIAL